MSYKEDLNGWFEEQQNKYLTCTCGVDKVDSTLPHSDYCSKSGIPPLVKPCDCNPDYKNPNGWHSPGCSNYVPKMTEEKPKQWTYDDVVKAINAHKTSK